MKGETKNDQATMLPTAGQFENLQASKLLCATVHPSLPLILYGTYTGDIAARFSTTSQEPCVLYSHRYRVKYVATCEGNIIESGDLFGYVQVWRFDTPQPGIFTAEKRIWSTKCSSAIWQLLFDSQGVYLLVSSAKVDYVYEVESGRLIGQMSVPQQTRDIQRWTVIPGTDQASRFALVLDHKLTTYVACEFPHASGYSLELGYDTDDDTENDFSKSRIASAVCHFGTMQLFLEVGQEHRYRSNSKLLVYDLSDAAEEHHTLRPRGVLSPNVFIHFLGISNTGESLVFLDSESWVSSIDVKSLGDACYVRYFFVPTELIRAGSDILPLQTADDDFIFCTYDSLAIIRQGLQFRHAAAMPTG